MTVKRGEMRRREAGGDFHGHVYFMRNALHFRTKENPNWSPGARAPRYRLIHAQAGYEVGNAFEQKAKESETVFLNMVFEGPELERVGGIQRFTAFELASDAEGVEPWMSAGDAFDIVWRAPQKAQPAEAGAGQ